MGSNVILCKGEGRVYGVANHVSAWAVRFSVYRQISGGRLWRKHREAGACPLGFFHLWGPEADCSSWKPQENDWRTVCKIQIPVCAWWFYLFEVLSLFVKRNAEKYWLKTYQQLPQCFWRQDGSGTLSVQGWSWVVGEWQRDRQRPHMDGEHSTKMKAPKTACLSSLEWGRYRYMGAICSVSSEERRQKQKTQYVWLFF